MSSKPDNVNATGDEQFTVFAFSVISVVVISMYIPWLWGLASRLVTHYTRTDRRRPSDGDPVKEIIDAVTFIPLLIFKFVTKPGLLMGGAEALLAQPNLTMRLYAPKVLRFVVRPKIFVLWLWLFLFSLVMYSSLTYDPYRVLGLTSAATHTEVKKVYRGLSKINHPDHNKTEAARAIYPQIVKAYNTIMKGEDEEPQPDDFSVGVGLPSFLTAKGNETFVLFGMLGLLLAIPIGLFFKFRDSDKKIPKLIEKIKKDKECMALFFQQLLIPVDPSYVEKKLSRTATLNAIKGAGLAPANATEVIVAGFPNFPTFLSRCINPEKFGPEFAQLGFDAEGVAQLNGWAMTFGEKAMEDYEAKLAELTKSASAATIDSRSRIPVDLISADKYRAVRYLMQIHTDSVISDLEELQKNMPGELRACRTIIQIHRDTYDMLEYVFEREKPASSHMKQLIDVVRNLDDAMDKLIPDIQMVMQKYYKQYYEQQYGKKKMKQIQRMQQMRPRGNNMPQ